MTTPPDDPIEIMKGAISRYTGGDDVRLIVLEDALAAALTAAAEAGYVLVPREATEAMCAAVASTSIPDIYDHFSSKVLRECAQSVYAAMIEASLAAQKKG